MYSTYVCTNATNSLLKDEDLDEDFDDGNWRGVEYYPCAPKRGIFVALKSIKPYSGPRKKLLQGDLTCLRNCISIHIILFKGYILYAAPVLHLGLRLKSIVKIDVHVTSMFIQPLKSLTCNAFCYPKGIGSIGTCHGCLDIHKYFQ